VIYDFFTSKNIEAICFSKEMLSVTDDFVTT
jgi:hypothetical protein